MKTCLVAGLGNPGELYRETRHNVGFMALDYLADHLGTTGWSQRWHGWTTRTVLEGQSVILLKPTTFMNRSGESLGQAMAELNLEPSRLLVIHDDLDLPCGRLKMVYNRGHGGHNGIKSIIAAIGGRDFSRIRMGIGRPAPDIEVVEHVLSPFTGEERAIIDDLLPPVAEAVQLFAVKDGVAAMNHLNSAVRRAATGTAPGAGRQGDRPAAPPEDENAAEPAAPVTGSPDLK